MHRSNEDRSITTTLFGQPLAHGVEGESPVYVLSYGMGVESHAILERWIAEPSTRPFAEFSQLIVVTAQVGEEHLCDTVPNVEQRTLPLLRAHGIRFVELARRGYYEEAGVTVLQDSRAPDRLHPAGVFKLSDELLQCGTIPQFGGEHRCAMKFKAFVIEAWLAHEFQGSTAVPLFTSDGIALGPASLTSSRATPMVVFGFNADEVSRIDRNRMYDGTLRKGLYPLQDWGWGRDACHSYIMARSGIDWKKSACAFCPFNSDASKGTDAAVARWKASPQQTAHGLIVEHNALSFNPRGQLFKAKALIDVVRARGVDSVIDQFEQRLHCMSWGLYRVRRIYTSKGAAVRCVERQAEGTRAEMLNALDCLVLADPTLQVETKRGIRYAMFHCRAANVYPAAEGFFVAAPLFVESKVRGPISKFNERWERVVAGGALNDESFDPKQKQIPLDDVEVAA